MKQSGAVTEFDKVKVGKNPLHLAIGMFDGVHLGHRAVIEAAIQSARRSGDVSGILTFYPHPSRVLYPENPTPLLISSKMKTSILYEMGVDFVIQKEFTQIFAQVEAEDFLTTLKQTLPTLVSVFVGEDYRFGKNRRGDVCLMIKEARRLGLHVFSVERIKLNGEDISSTRIREHIQAGRIEESNQLLGYVYSCAGRVCRGQKIGRGIGFPTLNLSWTPELFPRFGVYAVRVVLEGCEKCLPGVANYGIRPTTSEKGEPLLEVHLLKDLDVQLGTKLVVKWYTFIRPEIRFPHLDALRRQIAIDKEKAFQILSSVC
ncbi:MAG: Riboflavin biosynthesis protein RibF [Candidatus Moanabacter tarae]|uniref:Riboflavin biosynthesis protein n=1 Tax=Candidatus Moanibacter tarae TaxID=2200854 RepID=A0A2Z4AIM9_9BACT|nr:MAG: Riboflavin biosynthesis protein RibF [Candidatus Moanabacter tarae]|tara:strand:+ start:4416 stop:5363 length:948 start_codon:yes stop_codon:yes gene_type:complete